MVRFSLERKVTELKSKESEHSLSTSDISVEEQEEPLSKQQKIALLQSFSEEAGSSMDNSGYKSGHLLF